MSRRNKDEVTRDIRALVRSEEWKRVLPDRELPDEGAARELPPRLARALHESLKPQAKPRVSWFKWLWPFGVFAFAGIALVVGVHDDDGRSIKGGPALVSEMTVFCDGVQTRFPFTCAVGRPLKASMAKPDEFGHGAIFLVDSRHALAGNLAPQETGVEYDRTVTMSREPLWFGTFWSSRPFTEAKLKAALSDLIAKPSNLGHASSIPGLEGTLFWAEITSVQ